MRGQLSLFSAEQLPPDVDDLDGLLAGPGQAVRRGGSARVSIVVSPGWRVEALLAEHAARGLAADVVDAAAAAVSVQTGFDARLAALAQRWSSGGRKRPPAGLVLDGPRLRLWCVGAGQRDSVGWLLRLGAHDEHAWPRVGACLAAAGLAGTFVGPRAGGPAYRLVGARRLVRLRELVGDPPPSAPEQDWPAG